MSMTKPTSEQVTFLGAGTNAALRTALDKFRDVVSVKDFGAVGDNVADDTAAIQAAIDHASANNVAVYVPSGIYKVTANLNVPAAQRFYMYGDGRNSRIVATSAVTRMFDLATGIQYPVFRDMLLSSDAFSTTTSGIYGAGPCSHMKVDNVMLQGFNIGIYVRNGWCNLFSNVTVWYCRTGVDLGASANQCTFLHCKFWLNLYGAIIEGGYKVSMYCCLFEQNAYTGIVVSVSGLNLNGCYFENNAAVTAGQHPSGTVAGIPFTTPATTVLCSIFVPGGGTEWQSGTMALYAPRTGLTIDSCFVQAGGSEADGHAFVYGISATKIRISGCVRASGFSVPLLKTYGGFTQNVTDTRIVANEGFSKNYTADIFTDGIRMVNRIIAFDDTAQQVNFAVTDLSRWSQSAFGSVGTWERRDVAGPLGTKIPAYAIVQASTATTYLFGFTVDAADYPQNAGKMFQFTTWLKAANSSIAVWLYAFVNPGSGATLPSTAWDRRSAYFVWPASGNITLGVAKSSNAGELLVAGPILAEVGANLSELERQFVPQYEFYGTAAPSAGDWLRGDRVWNTTPSAGGDPGWVCVSAGTPGTWKAMANVDA